MKITLTMAFIFGLFSNLINPYKIQYLNKEYCKKKRGSYSENIQYNSLANKYTKIIICKNIK